MEYTILCFHFCGAESCSSLVQVQWGAIVSAATSAFPEHEAVVSFVLILEGLLAQ